MQKEIGMVDNRINGMNLARINILQIHDSTIEGNGLENKPWHYQSTQVFRRIRLKLPHQRIPPTTSPSSPQILPIALSHLPSLRFPPPSFSPAATLPLQSLFCTKC